MNIDELNIGIWAILGKYKTKNLDLTSMGYKEYYTIMQHIENFKNNDNFCISYTKYEGCANPNCVKGKAVNEYFSPAINFNDEYIIQYSIDSLIDFLFSPQNSYCTKCQ